MTKMTKKVESDLILSMKDVEEAKANNIDRKKDNMALKIEDGLEQYNQEIVRALEAPVPKISLHYNEVLLRAVPAEIKSRSGIILGTPNANNFLTAKKLTRMSSAVSFFQEILMVGDLVSESEKESGIRPGRIARVKFDRYRVLSDDHLPGVIETNYEVPKEIIEGYPYLILDKRDIFYTKDA